ncbi:hypothetical protein KP509_04G093300 [Ceratopteris richardii]|uniref:Uncharacterized protein n=1 Tax=Ceratopteris richardii TaxID=49495 RepID=A0A8T2V778_CERRI|nr:hypothetical protein KP509_04G093300 [Ceratopteris richardii]
MHDIAFLQGKLVPDEVKDDSDRNCQIMCGEESGNPQCISSKAQNAGHKLDIHYGRVSGNNLGKSSAIGTWAALVSNPACRLSTSAFGLPEAMSTKDTRNLSCKEKTPTFASHLELTGNVLSQSGPLGAHREVSVITSACQSLSLQTSPHNHSNENFRLNTGSLSVVDPVPYGMSQGFLHHTFKDGVPYYELHLDDYEEILTAKVCLEHCILGRYEELWVFKETKKEKKKNYGWRNWSRKKKLDVTLMGKMKISSAVCFDKQNLSLKSECILLRVGLDEPVVNKSLNDSTKWHLPFSRVACFPRDANCSACLLPALNLIAPCLLPKNFSGSKVAHRTEGPIQFGDFKQSIQTARYDAERQDTSDCLSSNGKYSHLELAAVIVDVPLQMQSGPVTYKEQCQTCITVILPSGNHGMPLCDLEGPSPLVNRWREGGTCDCNGWDLGCGFMVLSSGAGNFKLENPEDDYQCGLLRLCKQGTEKGEVLCSLLSQPDGIIALGFRAPLSPMQAFAIAVATLHSQTGKVYTVCNSVWKSFTGKTYNQDKDGESKMPVKSAEFKSKVVISSDLKHPQTLQTEIAIQQGQGLTDAECLEVDSTYL